ncbi:MAG: ion transporter [Propionivibrio sp.]|uniref:Ion transporter n=1 Tax=Candidatus Propionivibrio dominans TaxID=2954373 RepID=A0A9D7F678_9RHOO|nr:ion transporter [Candidatus Propionivibrio dominans]MBL0167012.1 ion transporter [Propionivibrio sp.]
MANKASYAPRNFAGLAAWLETPLVQRTLIVLILVNAVILGLETSPSLMADWGPWLVAADRAILAVFVVEIALRLIAHRFNYFRDPWNVFDFTVVAIALIPASGPLAVLRALRVLRVLRLITMVPSMKRVVGGLLSALPGLGSVSAIIGIIFYVSAVIATKLFAGQFPELFGDLGRTAFTLFQVMTLEGWAMEVVRPVMAVYPLAWIFFLLFILASTFTLLNLFIAVIVNAIQQEHGDEAKPVAESEMAALRREIAALRKQLQTIRPQASAARNKR